MSVKALQDYTFVSKYARYLPEKKRRETWTEAVERVRDMHLRKYPQIYDEIMWALNCLECRRVVKEESSFQKGSTLSLHLVYSHLALHVTLDQKNH
jgi:hypothetical protein